MIDKNSSLEDILEHSWGLLGRGGADAKHPFHYPVLATFNHTGVQQRTVVLRDTQRPDGLLITYSDIRTQKIADMRENGQANWLFYDHSSKEQIRAKGSVTVHHQDEESRKKWDDIPPGARGDYMGPHPPGTEADQYENNLPKSFLEEPTQENTAVGIEHFCMIISRIQEIDYLKLMRGGHLRCRFSREEDENAWKKHWLAP